MSTTVNLSVARSLFIEEASVGQSSSDPESSPFSIILSSLSFRQWRLRRSSIRINPVWASFFSVAAALALARYRQRCVLCKQLLDVDSNIHPVNNKAVDQENRSASVYVWCACDQDNQSSTWADLRHSPLFPGMWKVHVHNLYLISSSSHTQNSEYLSRALPNAVTPLCLLLVSLSFVWILEFSSWLFAQRSFSWCRPACMFMRIPSPGTPNPDLSCWEKKKKNKTKKKTVAARSCEGQKCWKSEEVAQHQQPLRAYQACGKELAADK